MGGGVVAGDSYSLDEVSALLAVPVSELVRRIEEGAFPGRFLTADWEMRVPVQDVRKAVEAMRRSQPSRAMVPSSPEGGSALVDPSALSEALEAWWAAREDRLLAELREVLRQEDERWATVETLLNDVRGRLARLEEGQRLSSIGPVDGEAWVSEIDEVAGGPMESILEDLRDLERLLGLGGDGEGPGGEAG